MLTSSVSTAALEKAFSVSWQKMQLIADNIANEDTPGYKAKRLEFDSILRKELRNRARSSSSSQAAVDRIESLRPRVYSDRSTEARVDGNNVNIDSEEIELARIQLQYTALQQRISGHYNTLKYAISGGR